MDATIQDTYLCFRQACGKPIVVMHGNARIRRYRLQPNFGRVEAVCGCCRAINELPPGVMVDLAACIGCPQPISEGYVPLHQLEAFEANTGLKVITVDHPVTTKGQEYLAKLAAMSEVPAQMYDTPSAENDPFDRWLRELIHDGGPLTEAEEATVATLAVWLESVTPARIAAALGQP